MKYPSHCGHHEKSHTLARTHTLAHTRVVVTLCLLKQQLAEAASLRRSVALFAFHINCFAQFSPLFSPLFVFYFLPTCFIFFLAFFPLVVVVAVAVFASLALVLNFHTNFWRIFLWPARISFNFCYICVPLWARAKRVLISYACCLYFRPRCPLPDEEPGRSLGSSRVESSLIYCGSPAKDHREKLHSYSYSLFLFGFSSSSFHSILFYFFSFCFWK